MPVLNTLGYKSHGANDSIGTVEHCRVVVTVPRSTFHALHYHMI